MHSHGPESWDSSGDAIWHEQPYPGTEGWDTLGKSGITHSQLGNQSSQAWWSPEHEGVSNQGITQSGPHNHPGRSRQQMSYRKGGRVTGGSQNFNQGRGNRR